MKTPYRSPVDTLTEFRPVEVAAGTDLDRSGAKYHVSRLPSEDDVSYRERIRDAMEVQRASRAVLRGERVVGVAELTEYAATAVFQLREEVEAKREAAQRALTALDAGDYAALREALREVAQ